VLLECDRERETMFVDFSDIGLAAAATHHEDIEQRHFPRPPFQLGSEDVAGATFRIREDEQDRPASIILQGDRLSVYRGQREQWRRELQRRRALDLLRPWSTQHVHDVDVAVRPDGEDVLVAERRMYY
jgi:hypothetical protein